MSRTSQTLEHLKSQRSKCNSELSDMDRDSLTASQDAFEENSGCTRCRGRGWIVTWDTLDCMQGSYAEYGSCDAEGCTKESREKSGFHPSNNKYDRNRGTKWFPSYTAEQNVRRESLMNQIRKLDGDISIEFAKLEPSPGKVVRVVKESRAKKASRRVRVGVEGIIKKLHTNDWGQTKAIIMDRDGNQLWPAVEQLEVIDANPDMEFWNSVDLVNRSQTGFPIIATVLKKSQNAALVRTTQAKEIWVPFSQVPELKKISRNSTASVMFPMWLARSNGFCQ